MKKLIIIIISILLILPIRPVVEVKAASKQYMILVADQKGKYTFYDLNGSETEGKIEISSNGNVMVSLKKLSDLIPDMKYQYNSKTKEASVWNRTNGKRLVFKKNKQEYDYFSSTKTKALKKSMPFKMYLSSENSSAMVHMSALKWLLNTTKGYQYYKISDMQLAGYDTFQYSGLIIYNAYGKVDSLPKAANVAGISTTVRVTIPEGFSLVQIFDLLVKKGVCASTDLLYDALDHYDFSYYPLVGMIEVNENRCFKLEGYLYPDTYEFYRLSKPQDILGKFLRNSESRITEEDRNRAKNLGYTMDEILTIASLIEKEAGDKSTKFTVSSVIHNRLKIGMKLQLDASIYYVERYIKPFIDGDINRYNEYYNTYKCMALPAGPICNPGRNAIQAALYPEESDYLFFYSDKEGKYYFSKEYVKAE